MGQIRIYQKPILIERQIQQYCYGDPSVGTYGETIDVFVILEEPLLELYQSDLTWLKNMAIDIFSE